ncbi:MAG: ATP-binding protein, partial [Acidimicrobiales bacterium]
SSRSERRVCSVLFCDLVGFTPYSQSRDPEEVRAMLSLYFERAKTVVTRYGGVVEKFIGDAVMAVWGTPVATEEDTERAVRAALELVETVEALGEELGTTELSARAGVVTGEVAVHLDAAGEGMVAGDAVNTASRVQAAAEPGSVYTDEATRRLCESAISFVDKGDHELKGKQAKEHLHCVVRVLSGVRGSQRPAGLEAPLAGRDRELRALKDLFHASVDKGSPYLAVVSGPAGVGKSRLGWELEKYIDGLAETMLWHRGRCLSYGEGVSFWALAEIVRRRFGIAEEETTKAASAKLKEGLVRFVGDDTERDYVGVRLARLLGLEYESRDKVVLTKEELFAGWRLFFERLAQVAPVVMLVEDAQHADESLLSFFEHLIDWTRDLPIFVLLFARPGLAAIDAGYGVGRNRSTLSLDPLSDTAMGELVEALVPGMPAPAREAITSRADGIPLFAVETVRSLLDQGVVSKEGESYRLTGTLGALGVPDSLHGLLAARIDALAPEVRALVADASVLGSSFSKEGLVAVSAKDAAEVEEGLSDLVRRDVLQVSADPLSPERGSYRFSQEMLRQVAYETLSRTDRKSRHLAVAAHLRAAFADDGEEMADAIARHYLDARAAMPSDKDEEEITSQALSFLVRAGERAKSSGALQQAATAFAE